MIDAVQQFAHDHAAINVRIVKLAALVRALDPHAAATAATLADPLAELREELFLHFAREEEGLFPFIEKILPRLATNLTAMIATHDAICGALVRTHHLAANDATVTTISAAFERFVDAYVARASAEGALLESLASQLDDAQRAQLALIVAGTSPRAGAEAHGYFRVNSCG